MSFYRAALAAANSGDLTAAARLARVSLAIGEGEPNAAQLLNLLDHRAGTAIASKGGWDRVRAMVAGRRYRRALLVRLPRTAASYNIRGLLYAMVGCRRAARKQFALALALDTGNALARQAIAACGSPQQDGGVL